MYAAYEGLSPHMQRFVDDLTAIHDFARPLEDAMRAGLQAADHASTRCGRRTRPPSTRSRVPTR